MPKLDQEYTTRYQSYESSEDYLDLLAKYQNADGEIGARPGSLMNEMPNSEFKERSGRRVLKKSQTDKKVFGVCGGLAEYLGIDSTFIRIAFVLSVFASGIHEAFGFTVLVYLLLGFVLPKR